MPSPFGDVLPGNVSLPQGVDPALFLVAQVNRFFTAAPPAGFAGAGLKGVPFPTVAGQIPANAALGAVLIVQRAAAEAFVNFNDPTSSALIDQADAAFTNPTAFVGANVAQIAGTLAAYGDSLGLAKAQLPGQILSVDPKTLMLVAAAGVGLLLLLRRG